MATKDSIYIERPKIKRFNRDRPKIKRFNIDRPKIKRFNIKKPRKMIQYQKGQNQKVQFSKDPIFKRSKKGLIFNRSSFQNIHF